MSPSQSQILEEMGLSPQWVLRENPTVARRARKPPERVASPLPEASKKVVAPIEMPTPEILSADAAKARADLIALMDWEQLRQSMATCRACTLCSERKQVVGGVGDGNAEWLLIGDAPDAEADASGEPLVGLSGKLLDAMLAAIDLKRDENVYIANAVSCHSTAHRQPTASELAACAPYLKRQIELVQPKLLLLLGPTAVQAALSEAAPLAALRGKPHTYRQGEQDIPAIVTYHPAYLLRNLPDKAKAWEDLCQARAQFCL